MDGVISCFDGLARIFPNLEVRWMICHIRYGDCHGVQDLLHVQQSAMLLMQHVVSMQLQCNLRCQHAEALRIASLYALLLTSIAMYV